MRERVALMWRRALRPARGVVPTGAEAILFADAGEWLACLGLAVARREVERHWCWPSALGAGGAVSSTQTLVHAWAQSPRFIPAALVRLAHCGEAARVLGALQPEEAGTLLSALRVEFDLPYAASARHKLNAFDARDARTTDTTHDASTEPSPAKRVAALRRADGDELGAFESTNAVGAGIQAGAEPGGTRDAVGSGAERDADGSGAEEALAPPWKRWLPTAGVECERLHATAQRLLAFAAALFHAPALARSSRFAAEVFAFAEGDATRTQPSSDAATARPETKPRALVSDENSNANESRGVNESDSANESRNASDSATSRAARGDDARHGRSELESATPSRSPRVQESERDSAPEQATPQQPSHETARRSTGEARDCDVSVVADEEGEADAHHAPWDELEGCETRLGGALFLLNLFAGLHLPECFDDEYGLSGHITGWGLTELLTRTLLGSACARFDGDPLWGALASLDGRREGEPPAAGLRVGDDYRAPARWLKLFAPRDEAWLASEDNAGRLLLRHAGGFPIAVRTLGGLTLLEAAAQVADEYRAQGVAVGRLEEVGRLKDAGQPEDAPTTDAGAELGSDELGSDELGGEKLQSVGLRSEGRGGDGLSSQREPVHVFDGLYVHGGAALSRDLLRWMGWTFPFLTYALARSLAGEDEPGAEESARALLVRRGRLYCTATHVDLVLEMSGVSLAARRAGLDASPGWVRDLVRVVAFHYE
jgi:hypothetical protein